MLSDDPIDRLLLSSSPTAEVERSMQIRAAAQQALFKQADKSAVQRSLHARSRTQPGESLKDGDWCFVWRDNPLLNKRGWVGPGVVIMTQPNGNSIWISMRGKLLKCSREQVRRAAEEEWLGADLIRVLSREMLENLRRPGQQRGYVDVEREGPPPASADREFDSEAARAAPEASLPREPASMEEAGGPGSGTSTPTEEDITRRRVRSEATDDVPHSIRSTRPRMESTATGSGSRAEPQREPSGPSSAEPSEHPMAFRPYLAERTASNYVCYRSEEHEYGTYLEALEVNMDPGRVAPMEETNFKSSEAWAIYDDAQCRYFLVKRKNAGLLDYKNLNQADQKKFTEARAKEMKKLFDCGAIRKLSLKESRGFYRTYGKEYVLGSKYIEKWKAQEDGSPPIAKTRHCVLGWQDPHILQVERVAPTPSTEGENAGLQVIASEKWAAYVSDVRNAFGQSKKSNRNTPLACTQPPEGVPGMLPGELLLLETECYGLVSGPAWWRVTLVEWLEALGYRRNWYDGVRHAVARVGSQGEERRRDRHQS
jgi:hypothetical protein